MRNHTSIFTDNLDTFTYEDVFKTLEGIGSEGQRLDFKARIDDKRKVAFWACGFANSLGGILVVGIKDTDTTGGHVEASDFDVNISDGELTSVSSTIQSLVYPALACELKGFTSQVDTSKKLLLIRIPQSKFAPHEFIGKNEKHNLPIRRDREFRGLTLAEITALQQRQVGIPSSSPLGPCHPMLSIDRTLSDPQYFFGIRIWPEQYSEKRLILSLSQDDALYKIIKNSIGCNTMEKITHADGLHFKNKLGEFPADNVDRQAYIMSDGEITLRTQETKSERVYQIAELLANAYAISSQAYQVLGLGPRVLAHMEMKIDPEHKHYATELAFPHEYWDDFSYDVSADEFPDIAVDTLLHCLRAGGHSCEKSEIRSIFEGVWQREFTGVLSGDLRNSWVASPIGVPSNN